MAKKIYAIDSTNPPETLDNHIFYGMILDEDQKKFRDAIWNPEKLIVFCNAKAGTGKTQIAVMTAQLLYDYHRYEGIVYITAPVQEARIGFLPGTSQEKIAVYNEPFCQAALKANISFERAIYDDGYNEKTGSAYIQCVSHNFLRGCNFENKVVIIDEAQNFYVDELKKVLTRMHDNCKVVVIGHTGQNDLLHKPERSGFDAYIKHFENEPYAAVCTLTHNHRGVVANHADDLVI